MFFLDSDAPVPFSHRISFESSKTSSKIQVEKQDKITHSGFTSPPQRSQSMSSPPGKMGECELHGLEIKDVLT